MSQRSPLPFVLFVIHETARAESSLVVELLLYVEVLMGTYIGTVNGDTIYGSSTADVILGMGGADYLSGGDGNDIIADFDGQNPDTYSDTILGGAGNDTIYAGFGDYINGGSGTDTLNLRLDYTPGSLYVDVSVLWSGGSVTLGGATIQQVELINWVVGG